MASKHDEGWGVRYNEIVSAVCQHIEGECFVVFSAFTEDENGFPVNNLSDVALTGKVVVVEKDSPSWHPGKSYKSKIYENPTRLDLCVIANEIVKSTGDYHHIYLEAYNVLSEENGVQVIELFLGS